MLFLLSQGGSVCKLCLRVCLTCTQLWRLSGRSSAWLCPVAGTSGGIFLNEAERVSNGAEATERLFQEATCKDQVDAADSYLKNLLKTITGGDVTGFYGFFLPLEIGPFSPHFGAISLLNYTVNLEKRENIHWRKGKKSSGDAAPKCRFLSLVVVERLLINAPFLNGLFSRGFSRGKTAH